MHLPNCLYFGEVAIFMIRLKKWTRSKSEINVRDSKIDKVEYEKHITD